MKSVIVVSLVGFTCIAGCARSPATDGSQINAATPGSRPVQASNEVTQPANQPMIVELIGRDHTVIVNAGVTEPSYSIQSAGVVIAADLSANDLRNRLPHVYERLINSHARRGVLEWAGH